MILFPVVYIKRLYNKNSPADFLPSIVLYYNEFYIDFKKGYPYYTLGSIISSIPSLSLSLNASGSLVKISFANKYSLSGVFFIEFSVFLFCINIDIDPINSIKTDDIKNK